MNAGYFSLYDMVICGIPALAFGIWQLVSINREMAKDKKASLAQSEHASPDGVSPERSGHPIG
jgi:hypothetical protein